MPRQLVASHASSGWVDPVNGSVARPKRVAPGSHGLRR